MHKIEVGQRVRQSLGERTQKGVAQAVGMAPDAFSRALKGERAFSTLELSELAIKLGADLHWLITGAPDPNALTLAARHAYDHDRREHHLDGAEGDARLIDAVALAYRQVEGSVEASAPVDIPEEPAALRALLGEGFVESLTKRVELVLDVDVVALSGVSTDYAFSVTGRRVVVLRSTGNWFRRNFSLAHELAHIALGHLDERADDAEKAANEFAAQLLVPDASLTATDWSSATEVATLLWNLGVSTSVVRFRLEDLDITPSDEVAAGLEGSTQAFLRAHGPTELCGDTAIARRMERSARRRFPRWLEEAHTAAIERGDLGADTLEWMLDVQPGDMAMEAPMPRRAVTVDGLADALGF